MWASLSAYLTHTLHFIFIKLPDVASPPLHTSVSIEAWYLVNVVRIFCTCKFRLNEAVDSAAASAVMCGSSTCFCWSQHNFPWSLPCHGSAFVCRLQRAHGTVPSVLLYVLFFLPTSVNAAWLSIAGGLGVLIVPLSYGHTAYLQTAAAVTAVVATAAGETEKCCQRPK